MTDILVGDVAKRDGADTGSAYEAQVKTSDVKIRAIRITTETRY
jgi:hypothetical protein